MKKKIISIILIIVMFGLLLFAVRGILFNLYQEDGKEELLSVMEQGEEAPIVDVFQILEYAQYKAAVEMTTLEAILGSKIPITAEMKKAKLESSYVDLPGEGIFQFASIQSCKINPRTGKVKLQFSMEGIPRTDDEKLYLFELATYETSHSDNYISTASKWENGCFLFECDSNRLYSKYVIAVKKDGQYVDISRGHYITNPETLAQYQYEHPKAASIKGLIVDPAKLGGNELQELGVKQAAYNIPIGYILGETSNGNWPTIYYKYNGKTYAFNGQRIAEFDIVFKALTRKGIVTTAVLLNNKNGAYPQLIHPNAKGGSAPYYMFNASNSEGVELLKAVSTFLVKRYSGSEHGQIANWVVGNEINARQAWNYMDYTSVEAYTEAYADAFRVIYTAIKSVSANARVYMPLDQMWNRNLSATDSYDAKDVLDAFANTMSLKGDIDWSLAHHPYPVPLTWPKFWAMPANYARMNLVRNSVDTPYVTVQNIHVLTDYMCQESMLNEDGETRSILLNEVGFGSDHGETLQAAAFSYAYYIMEANQHIDGFIINKQSDMSVELAQGLALGLDRMDGSHKYIYNVFKMIDTPASKEATAFAKDIIGISDWSSVITSR